jgi:hypothetical protein
MASTRSSDYAAIGGGGNCISNRSRLSRRLARGPPPRGKKGEDNNSTPVAFDVDAGNGGEIEVNGECEGDGNSNGPIDNNDEDDHDIPDENDDNDNDGGWGWQDRSPNTGQLWRSGRRWR